MKRPMQYEVIEFKRLPADELEPHPAAALPMDEEDRGNLAASIAEHGLFQPLLVESEPQKNGRRRILDGINRWRGVEGRPNAVLPCLLVRCSDPRSLALECLSAGRKRTSGQRIMAFIEMHRTEVLQVADLLDGGHHVLRSKKRTQAGHVIGLDIPKELQDFTAEAIARRLGVSHVDVRCGIELARCLERREFPPLRDEIEPQPIPDGPEGEAMWGNLQQQAMNLMAGTSPIRTWKRAIAGRSVRKADVNYCELGFRSVTGLTTVFKHWDEVHPAARPNLEIKVREMLKALPAYLKRGFSERDHA